MRGPSVLFIVLALSGCVVHSPQMAQYKAEYSNRQDIHSHSLYRFKAKSVKSSEEKYWGAGDLTEFFYVKGDKTSTVELKLDYDSKTMHIKSLIRKTELWMKEHLSFSMAQKKNHQTQT